MEQNIDHIIAHVLSGDFSSEDILSLSKWLNESEKNQEEFRRLTNYWIADVSLKSSVISPNSLNKLIEKINTPAQPIQKRSPWKKYMCTAAAGVLLLIVSTFSLQYLAKGQQSKQNPEYYTFLTNESKSQFALEDGTRVTLNKHSRLRYSNDFGKDNRKVVLEGEAYFDVAKDSIHPFLIETNGASISVLGTQFNVNSQVEADNIVVTLIEGAVRFEKDKQNVLLSPNQQLTLYRETDEITIRQVDPQFFTSWKDGLIRYKSIPFIDLVKELENTYKVEIQVNGTKLKEPDVVVSASFSNDQSIEQILTTISRSLLILWYKKDAIYNIQYQHKK